MRIRQFITGAFLTSLILVAQLGAPTLHPLVTPPPQSATGIDTESTFSRLPLQFEANAGQADARIKFLAHGRGYALFLTANDITLALASPTVDHMACRSLQPASAARLSNMAVLFSQPVRRT